MKPETYEIVKIDGTPWPWYLVRPGLSLGKGFAKKSAAYKGGGGEDFLHNFYVCDREGRIVFKSVTRRAAKRKVRELKREKA